MRASTPTQALSFSLGLLLFSFAVAPAIAAAAGEPSLAAVRAASAKYQDVNTAIADGYTTDGKCMSAPMIGYPRSAGAMGLHYVRKDLIGITPGAPGERVTGTGTYTDFLRPSMLVYEPEPGGGVKLVAVENLVFQSAWEAAGHSGAPKFHGRNYVLLKDDPKTAVDEAHKYEPHYELHIWLYRRNPSGMFAEFNPQVSCERGTPHKM